MNLRLLILFAGMLCLFGACKKDVASDTQGALHESTSTELDSSCDSTQFEDILFKDSNGTLRLSGGDADSQHFDVSGWELEACNLGFCFCREHFPAVYKPRYTSIEEDAFRYHPEDAFIVAFGGGKSKAYSLELMVKHEAVNDTLNGDPILVAYCVLADLPIVYSRAYCGEELTFALSGYTYYEDQVMDGVQAFVLWDRETESLWWPFSDDALSGPMRGARLQEYPLFKWKVLTWASLQQEFPNAQLLATDILVDPPTQWQALDITAADCN
ncbi:MAG: DUF3179 domain-containing protein [Flavobacteriales bacterium]|nr:DUF3179 domain-containing protein [Flavobacteriales bacterium]